jgi:hypothetical protein
MVSDKQRLKYLVNLVFGDTTTNFVMSAVKQAYLDFSRTQHGFMNHPDHDEIQAGRQEWLIGEIRNTLNATFNDQEKFDNHHKLLMEKLIEKSKGGCTYGQAQKWINMTLKYCLIIDPKASSKNVSFFHVPIDNIIVRIIKEGGKDFPPVGIWSKLNNYRTYLNFQKKFRLEYPDNCPILEELRLWKRN